MTKFCFAKLGQLVSKIRPECSEEQIKTGQGENVTKTNLFQIP